MTTSPINKVCTRLYEVTGQQPTSNSNGFSAICPAHEDRTPSLSITEADDCVLIYCHAGCEIESVVNCLDMSVSELFSNSIDIDKTPSCNHKKLVSSTVNEKKSYPTLQDAISSLKSKPSKSREKG